MLETCEEIEFYVNFCFSNQSKKRLNNNLQGYFSNKLFIKYIAYIYSFFLFSRIKVSQYINIIRHLIFHRTTKHQHNNPKTQNKLVFCTVLICRYLLLLYSFLFECIINKQWIYCSFCDMNTINGKVIIYN